MPNRIDRSTALPVDLFADEAIFQIELSEIWHRDWIFATTVDAVAEPGDFVPVTIGRQPVIVVRGTDYKIRALANVCSHRGSPLVDCAGQTTRFSCPYHAWTYDSDGDLLSVPYALGDEVSKSELGLQSFRVDQWHELVFVSLNLDADPLADRIAVVDPYVKPLAFDRLHHDTAGVATEQWQANWKLVYSNALDSYSQFRVHAETIEPVSPTDASYYLAGSASATVAGGESNERADHLMISLPPSFVAVVYPDAMLWQAFTPIDVSTTAVTTGMAGETTLDGATPVNLPGWDAGFIDEDRAICERVQKSAASRWSPGPLLEIERALGDFHEFLAWRLAGRSPGAAVISAQPGDRPEPPHG